MGWFGTWSPVIVSGIFANYFPRSSRATMPVVDAFVVQLLGDLDLENHRLSIEMVPFDGWHVIFS